MKIPAFLSMRRTLFAATLLMTSGSSRAAETVTLWIEKAPSLEGPWKRVDLRTASLDADGNPRLPASNPRDFFRTQMRLGPAVQIGDVIPISEGPPDIVKRAKDLLAGRDETDPEGWPEDAELEPCIRPQYAVMGDGSVKPGYFEFKIIRKPKGRTPGSFPVTSPNEELPTDAGYILLSATEEDFPIAEFATEGPTPTERLARLAKTNRIRVVRYGPTLLVAEDENGRAVATQGAVPFRLTPEMLLLDGAEWRGDSDSGLDQRPKVPPRLTPEYYRDYDDFRNDFATNPVYVQLRKNKIARAKLDWDIIHGKVPETVTIPVGQTVTVLASLPAIPVPVYNFASDQGDIVRITLLPTGGIRVTGGAPGQGLLRVRQGSEEYVIAIEVSVGLGPRAVGDVIKTESWYALSWQEQPRYYQYSNPNWCELVGCGPVAWAILFAWFDRNQHIEYAFRGEGAGVDPPFDLSTIAKKTQVLPTYSDLHEYCDVICNAVTGEGGSVPSDMSEGFLDYTQDAIDSALLKRSWNIQSSSGNWPDAGALRSRDAIKKGYPAVTGLGWMWHYVVAYGYKYKTIFLGGSKTVDKRYIKCNMGWAGSAPRWYDLGDTFYSADVHLRNP
ncbi:MAG TPA: hypothetical protein VG796_30075 [Verrucomicrobiales bacterium]|nr:hypothetical protein [Verrucomicrobiales bacterium]